VAAPFTEDYSHMGDTPMRFRNVIDLMVNGSNKCGGLLE
jgi:hypothetical protein